MTRETLMNIADRVAMLQRRAERIMDGGENYDGTDGAWCVLDLCSMCDKLMQAVVVEDDEAGKVKS